MYHGEPTAQESRGLDTMPAAIFAGEHAAATPNEYPTEFAAAPLDPVTRWCSLTAREMLTEVGALYAADLGRTANCASTSEAAPDIEDIFADFPDDTRSEQNLLSAMLWDNGLAEHLSAEDFLEPQHRRIFVMTRALLMFRSAAPPIMVATLLGGVPPGPAPGGGYQGGDKPTALEWRLYEAGWGISDYVLQLGRYSPWR